MYASFSGSYTVILQPGFPPPAIEGIIERPSDASLTYIFRKEDGQLEYYVEGEFVKELTPEMLLLPPYSDLPSLTSQSKRCGWTLFGAANTQRQGLSQNF